MPTILNRRGRPPHPDILTPAEWRVLEGVRAGKTNQEIADDLGVTYHTVKFHISNMLSKLYLEDRQQLARWQRPRPAAPVPRWRRLGFGPLGALKALGAGASIAAAVGLAALAIIVIAAWRSNDTRGADAPETQAQQSSQGPSSLPQPSDGVTLSVQTAGGPPVELRGRTFTSLMLDVADIGQALPPGPLDITGDVRLLAHTPTGTVVVPVGDRQYFGASEDDHPGQGPKTYPFGMSIQAGPLPEGTLALEVRVDSLVVRGRNGDRLPLSLGPWVGVLSITGPPPDSVDLTSRVQTRVDTGFGWAWVIDGVEKIGQQLFVTFHVDGSDIEMLRCVCDGGGPPPVPGVADINLFGTAKVTEMVFLPEVMRGLPDGTGSIDLRLTPVLHASAAGGVSEPTFESGDWTVTVPIE